MVGLPNLTHLRALILEAHLGVDGDPRRPARISVSQ